MELRKAIFEMRFKPSLSFIEKMYQIGEKLEKDYSGWETDRLTLKFLDDEKRAKLILETYRIALSMDEPVMPDPFYTWIKRAVKRYNEAAPISDFLRIGLRLKYIEKTELNFDELVEIMGEKIYHAEIIKPFFGDGVEDIAMVLNLRSGEYKIHIESGPLKRKEIMPRLRPTFKDKFDEENEPETSLLIDIDCFRTGEGIKYTDEFVQDAHKVGQEISERLLKYIKGGSA